MEGEFISNKNKLDMGRLKLVKILGSASHLVDGRLSRLGRVYGRLTSQL